MKFRSGLGVRVALRDFNARTSVQAHNFMVSPTVLKEVQSLVQLMNMSTYVFCWISFMAIRTRMYQKEAVELIMCDIPWGS